MGDTTPATDVAKEVGQYTPPPVPPSPVTTPGDSTAGTTAETQTHTITARVIEGTKAPAPKKDGRRIAFIFGTIAAVAATILSAQGMVMTWYEVIQFPMAMAVSLGATLELALLGVALIDRSDALRGKSAKAMATWSFSVVAGLFASMHEIVNHTGVHTAPVDFVAAGLRLVPPLVAAYLWHRLLVGDLNEAQGVNVAQTRKQKRMLILARAIRRKNLAMKADERKSTRATRLTLSRAAGRKDKVYFKTVQAYGEASAEFLYDLDRAMRSVGIIDMLEDVASLDAAAQTLQSAAHVDDEEVARQREAQIEAARVQAELEAARRPQRRRTTPRPAAPRPTAGQASAAAPEHRDSPVFDQDQRVDVGTGSAQDRARAVFDKMIAADPTQKPDASVIHREAGVEKNPATTRRWVQAWFDEHVATLGDPAAQRDEAQLNAEAARHEDTGRSDRVAS